MAASIYWYSIVRPGTNNRRSRIYTQGKKYPGCWRSLGFLLRIFGGGSHRLRKRHSWEKVNSALDSPLSGTHRHLSWSHKTAATINVAMRVSTVLLFISTSGPYTSAGQVVHELATLLRQELQRQARTGRFSLSCAIGIPRRWKVKPLGSRFKWRILLTVDSTSWRIRVSSDGGRTP